MRVAFIFDKEGKQPMIEPGGKFRVFPVYKLWSYVKNERGMWQLDLHAFINACTEDFKFQQYQGLLSIGRNPRGLWLELTIGTHSLHLGARHV